MTGISSGFVFFFWFCYFMCASVMMNFRNERFQLHQSVLFV